MRREDRGGLIMRRASSFIAALLVGLATLAIGPLVAQDSAPAPRLRGAPDPMGEVRAPALDRPVVDDVKPMRNYPEHPPIIPHAIDGYQLTLNTNRCLSCHKREFTEGSGAPMISVTHFMDRDGQVLSDVTPRRYFCTACHVQQTDARPLVPNLFRDASAPGEQRR